MSQTHGVEELVAVTLAAKRVVDLYRRELGISDVQIINSSEAQAQQDVFHVQFHIVPRQRGDRPRRSMVDAPGVAWGFDDMGRSCATLARLSSSPRQGCRSHRSFYEAFPY